MNLKIFGYRVPCFSMKRVVSNPINKGNAYGGIQKLKYISYKKGQK